MTNEARITPAEAASLQRRARVSILLMSARSVVSQLVVLVGNVYLYRSLSPADYGMFAIVQFAITFFRLFGDAGLAAALIQKQEKPSQRELSSVWTLQLLIGGSTVLFLWFAAPWIIALWPSMPAESAWLLRCVALAFLLTLLRVVPTVLMERELAYGRFAALDVALTLGFYVPALILAASGFGALALGLAVVAQAALGAIGAFAMQRWKPGLAWDWPLLRPILKFGVAFQTKHVLGFAQSAAAPILGGGPLGQTALGQLGWAQSTAFFPLRLVEIVSRVGFPLYSRLQSDRAALADAVARSVHLCALGTFLFLSIVFGLGEPLIRVIFTASWSSAMWLLYAYAVAISLGILTPILAPAIDAIGRPDVNIRLSLLATILVWTLVPIGVYFHQARGFAAAYASVVIIGNLAAIVVTQRFIPGLRLVRALLGPATAMALTAALARASLHSRITGVVSCTLGVLATATLFGVIVSLIDPKARQHLQALWLRLLQKAR